MVNTKYPALPFSIRGFEDLTGARVGVKECLAHDLLIDYPVLTEKPGEYIAQFKATIAIQPKSVAILCGGRDLFNADGIVSEKKLDEAHSNLIKQPLWKAEEKKKEKKAKE